MQWVPGNAEVVDTTELTEVAHAAKRHWGYPEEWIALWSDELTIRPDYLMRHRVRVIRDGRILGWCATYRDDDDVAWLEACWVRPECSGQGIGKRLVDDAVRIAAELGASTMRVVSDPNAEGFYERLGFVRIGESPSRPGNRRLPVLERSLGVV